MSKYGSGLSFGAACMRDKERIRHALQGELLCGETEQGMTFAKASREECEAYILGAYDDCVFQARQVMVSGRALERAVIGTLVDPRAWDDVIYPAFLLMKAEEEEADDRNGEYVYECEKDITELDEVGEIGGVKNE